MNKFECPCCGELTIDERNDNEICPVCGWEDDWWDSNNPDSLPSSNWLTLNEARKMYRETGTNILKILKDKLAKEKVRSEYANLGQRYNDKGWDLQNGLTSGTPDPDSAIEWYEKAVEYGNTMAMVNLGNIYESREEYVEAYDWYLEAALANNEQGMLNVANMHFWGWHVPQDYQKAYDYFAKLNKLGVKGTNYYLGLYAENGYLEEKDYEKAKYYYAKGIEEGDIYCPVNLGRMYCLGLGGPVNFEKGFELYYQGYLMGDVLACANLGYCYETGQGVEKNMELALLYYREGAEKGEEHCIEAMQRLLGEDW